MYRAFLLMMVKPQGANRVYKMYVSKRHLHLKLITTQKNMKIALYIFIVLMYFCQFSMGHTMHSLEHLHKRVRLVVLSRLKQSFKNRSLSLKKRHSWLQSWKIVLKIFHEFQEFFELPYRLDIYELLNRTSSQIV